MRSPAVTRGAQAVSTGVSPEEVIVAVDENDESPMVVTLETSQSPIGWLNANVLWNA